MFAAVSPGIPPQARQSDVPAQDAEVADVELARVSRPVADPPPPVAQRARAVAQVHPPVVSGVVPLRDVYPLLRTVPRALYACAASALTLQAVLPVRDENARLALTIGTGVAMVVAGVAAAVDIVTRTVDAGARCVDWLHQLPGDASADDQLSAIVAHVAFGRGPLDELGLGGAIERLRLVRERHPGEISGERMAQSIARLAHAVVASTGWPRRLDVLTGAISHMYRREEISLDSMLAAMVAMLDARVPAHQVTELKRYVIAAVAAAPLDDRDRQAALVRLGLHYADPGFKRMIGERMCAFETGTPEQRLAAAMLRLNAISAPQIGAVLERLEPAPTGERVPFSGTSMRLNEADDTVDVPVRIHVSDGKKRSMPISKNFQGNAAGSISASHEHQRPAPDLQAWVEESPATRAASTPD